MKSIFIASFFFFLVYNVSGQIVYNPQKNRSQVDINIPKEYVIGGISVSGTTSLDNNVLIAISKLKVGDRVKIPGDKISGAVKDLWAQGLFEDVQVVINETRQDSLFIDLHLVERPRLSTIIFQGLKKSEISELNEKKLKDVSGKIVNENLIQSSISTVRKYFADKGYYNTRISVVQRQDSSLGRIDLIFDVDKQSKTKVNKIDIVGNKILSDKKLKKTLKSTKESKWYKVFGSKKFLETKYDEDKLALLKKYKELGYRDANILSDTVFNKDAKSVDVILTVSEGSVYYFGNIDWVGNAIYKTDQLARILQIKKGDVYNEEKLNQRLRSSPSEDDVSSLYLNNGYLFFQVNPVQTQVLSDSISLEMRIYEGEQATINNVSIVGNDRTNDKVALREVRTKPGDKFNKSQLISTIRVLNQLGYFDEQKTVPDVQPSPQDGTVDITYNVTEKPSDQLELSGGFGGGRVIGTLGVSFNNFSLRKLLTKDWGGILPSGDGQKLQLRVQSNGKYYQAYSFSFSEPWLGGDKPRYFTFGLTHTNQNLSGLDKSSPDYRGLQLTGVTLGLGQRLKWPDDNFQLSTGLTFNRYNFAKYEGFDQFPTGTAYTFSLTETLGRNSIDAPIYPTSGSNVQLSVEATPPYSLFGNRDYTTLEPQEKYKFTEFHRWKFDAGWYMKASASSKLVFHVELHAGFLGHYDQRIGTTQFDRWKVGGSGLQGQDYLQGVEVVPLRGYSDNSVVPEGRGVNDYYLGSPLYSRYIFELRHPITLNQSATIFALAFLEAGNAWDNFRTYNPFNVKRSAGAGVRIFLPIFGMLGLDYGYGFDKVPSSGGTKTNGGQFHFSIAQQLGGF